MRRRRFGPGQRGPVDLLISKVTGSLTTLATATGAVANPSANAAERIRTRNALVMAMAPRSICEDCLTLVILTCSRSNVSYH